jgi:hypothetical protein
MRLRARNFWVFLRGSLPGKRNTPRVGYTRGVSLYLETVS